ncbi:lipid-A-disaccharide synthase N-terminal domain-containing protein [Halosquirtibacter laminarini]|uniref:Lipid-A-disaccharide synthase N-terminal domain-containing protein n=1 Tax=Halosquirtibacter laminarini TaxID=3374600 RepID=A0AC61NF70_9BACT|nr:lipid-A-disaccharide synthase N-terminal domain-containing protein [Prolixibacteraceae bacterium]
MIQFIYDIIQQDQWYIFAIGLVGNILFSSRVLIQWFLSEKSGKSESPTVFWHISLWASFTFLIYGILRKDLAIVMGQLMVYFIYIRNIQIQNKWREISKFFRISFLIAPFVIISYISICQKGLFYNIISNDEIPFKLLIWGSLGQFVFVFRFFFQWIVSEEKGKSVLPLGFWIISLSGSLIIISYAVYRKDINLILGQIAGTFVYFRNIVINIKGKGLFQS